MTEYWVTYRMNGTKHIVAGLEGCDAVYRKNATHLHRAGLGPYRCKRIGGWLK